MSAPQDRSAATLIRESYALLRAHWQLALPLVLLGLVTGSGRRGGTPMRLEPTQLTPEQILLLIPFVALLGAIALVVIIALFFAYVAASLVVTHGALAIVRGDALPDWSAAWAATKPRFKMGASATILAILAVLAGLILLVVPGLIVLSALFPTMVIVVAEAKGGSAALKRAWEITRGERMSLFVVFLAAIGIDIAATILLAWIPLVGGALAGIVSGAVNTGITIAAALWYHRRIEMPTPTPPAARPVQPGVPGF